MEIIEDQDPGRDPDRGVIDDPSQGQCLLLHGDATDPNQEVYHHLTRGVPDHHLPESPGVDPGPCLPHTSEPPNPGLVLGPVRPHAGNGRRRGAPLQITEYNHFIK